MNKSIVSLAYALFVIIFFIFISISLYFIYSSYQYQLSTDYNKIYMYTDNFVFYKDLQELELASNIYVQKNSEQYSLRIATYGKYKNAMYMQKKLLNLGITSAIKEIISAKKLSLYRLYIGPVTSRSEISALQDTLARNNISSNLHEIK